MTERGDIQRARGVLARAREEASAVVVMGRALIDRTTWRSRAAEEFSRSVVEWTDRLRALLQKIDEWDADLAREESAAVWRESEEPAAIWRTGMG